VSPIPVPVVRLNQLRWFLDVILAHVLPVTLTARAAHHHRARQISALTEIRSSQLRCAER
jgi:hypothetical protein